MKHNTKVYLFAAVVVGTALALWGMKGVMTFLPGPNPK